MTTTRRQFITQATAAVAATTLLPGALHAAGPAGKAQKPLRILILGGTGFLGPACTESALARGHAVTLFNSLSEPFTGAVEIALDSTWNDNGRVCVRQSDPLPLTILAAIPDVSVGR